MQLGYQRAEGVAQTSPEFRSTGAELFGREPQYLLKEEEGPAPISFQLSGLLGQHWILCRIGVGGKSP